MLRVIGVVIFFHRRPSRVGAIFKRSIGRVELVAEDQVIHTWGFHRNRCRSGELGGFISRPLSGRLSWLRLAPPSSLVPGNVVAMVRLLFKRGGSRNDFEGRHGEFFLGSVGVDPPGVDS